MPSRSKKTTVAQNTSSKPASTSSNFANTSSQPAMPPADPVRTPPLTNGQQTNTRAEVVSRTGDSTESAGELVSAPAGVNRKKQKRREKEAAKRAAEQNVVNGRPPLNLQQPNGPLLPPHGRPPAKGYFTEEPDYVDNDFAETVGSPDDAFYSGDEDAYGDEGSLQADNSWLNTSKRKKTSRPRRPMPIPSNALMRPKSNLPVLSNAAIRSAHKMSNDHIWNTSTAAERENIKQFWLELGEEERRSLVKVEKEAVLKKMKEQQKHSCSCSVCGRKRTAIEEELEVLYDAYYEELEQFANHNDGSGPAQIMPPPRAYADLRGPAHPPGAYPSQGRVEELGDEDDEYDDEEEYDEDEEPYSDEDLDDDLALPPGPPDFFQFGNSLTVKDGILTVADDLLKNDGKHFIDMMEQLAERRMQREEDIRYPSSALAHQNLQGHNHPPLDDEDDYDEEEDDEDYDSQDEDDYEGDEMDSMTEEQRMEEGRRMFQIFAARMFEQRVLTAYREKVAAERQRKLLEELEEETRLDANREAKKAREAAKKKEKKRLQKQAKDEEKAKKDAEKAAEEAAAREAEERKLEEQRQRKEEQRKKREAERKSAEEEKAKKDAEKQRRQQAERDKQAETERKLREAKEREKKQRDEAKKKEREEREAKEKDARERKMIEEKERKAKDDQARKEKDATMRAEKEVKDRAAAAAARPQVVALPPGLHPPVRSAQLQSPLFQIATPIVPPKVPTPGRNRNASQPSQQSHASSPHSQKASTEVSHSASPASAAVPQTPSQPQASKVHGPAPPLHHPQPSAPRSPLNNIGRGQYPYGMNGLPGLGLNGPPMSGSSIPPGMSSALPMYQGPPMPSQHRFAPNPMQYPPGFGGPRPFQSTQGMPFHNQPPATSMAPSQPPMQIPNLQSDSRQLSGSRADFAQPAPIARPGPITRPSSGTPEEQKARQSLQNGDVEQITQQLGSKALLDDFDEPLPTQNELRTSLPPVGAPSSARLPFSSSFPEPKHDAFGMNPSFGFNPISSNNNWGPQRPNQGWSQQSFGPIGHGPQHTQRHHVPRPISVRLMLVQACRTLSATPGSSPDGYHPAQTVLRQADQLKIPGESPVAMDEMLEICDTEGNAQNGGGTFEVKIDPNRGQVIRYSEDVDKIAPRSSVGDIGSPVPMQSTPFGSIGSGFGPPGRTF